MEVCDQLIHETVLKPRLDDDLRVADKRRTATLLQIADQRIERLRHRHLVDPLVRHPLADVERLLHAVEDIDPHIVQALQRAGGGGADGDDLSSRPLLLGDDSECLQRHLDHLLMHLVTAHGAALDGGKGSGTHMERHTRLTNPPLLQLPEHPVCEVQPGGRRSDTPLYPCIDGLVGDEIGRLGVAVEVRRYRQLAHLLKDVGEGAVRIPREANQSVADALHGERAA